MQSKHSNRVRDTFKFRQTQKGGRKKPHKPSQSAHSLDQSVVSYQKPVQDDIQVPTNERIYKKNYWKEAPQENPQENCLIYRSCRRNVEKQCLQVYLFCSTMNRDELYVINALLDKEQNNLQYQYQFLKQQTTPLALRGNITEISVDKDGDSPIPGTPDTEKYIEQEMAVANMNTIKMFTPKDQLIIKRQVKYLKKLEANVARQQQTADLFVKDLQDQNNRMEIQLAQMKNQPHQRIQSQNLIENMQQMLVDNEVEPYKTFKDLDTLPKCHKRIKILQNALTNRIDNSDKVKKLMGEIDILLSENSSIPLEMLQANKIYDNYTESRRQSIQSMIGQPVIGQQSPAGFESPPRKNLMLWNDHQANSVVQIGDCLNGRESLIIDGYEADNNSQQNIQNIVIEQKQIVLEEEVKKQTTAKKQTDTQKQKQDKQKDTQTDMTNTKNTKGAVQIELESQYQLNSTLTQIDHSKKTAVVCINPTVHSEKQDKYELELMTRLRKDGYQYSIINLAEQQLNESGVIRPHITVNAIQERLETEQQKQKNILQNNLTENIICEFLKTGPKQLTELSWHVTKDLKYFNSLPFTKVLEQYVLGMKSKRFICEDNDDELRLTLCKKNQFIAGKGHRDTKLKPQTMKPKKQPNKRWK